MFQRGETGIIEMPGKDNLLIDVVEEQDIVNNRIVEAKVLLEYCKEYVLYFSASEYIRNEEIKDVVTKEYIEKGKFKI